MKYGVHVFIRKQRQELQTLVVVVGRSWYVALLIYSKSVCGFRVLFVFVVVQKVTISFVTSIRPYVITRLLLDEFS
jgi:hypothetical protein